jgi:phosphoribosylglycinamide formyltransferase-1
MSDPGLTPSFISPAISLADLPLSKTLKLGVMASGSGSNFESLMAVINQGQLNAQVQVVIYNNPTAKVKERAERWQVPSVLLDHRLFNSRESLDQAIVTTLKDYDVDWVIMAGWMRVVTEVLLKAFPGRVINIHPSLLPSFKGINAVKQALEAQVKITGATVHLASLDVDSGPILMQVAVPILPDDTLETLHQRIQIQEHLIFPQAIALAVKMATDG